PRVGEPARRDGPRLGKLDHVPPPRGRGSGCMKLLDLYPAGERVVTGSKEFTADSIIAFARKYDPQPFHTDAEAAKTYVFGALCASGWHTCAEWMRCFVDFWRAENSRLLAEGKEPPKLGPSPGFNELQWLKPVFAGDVVSYSITGADSR